MNTLRISIHTLLIFFILAFSVFSFKNVLADKTPRVLINISEFDGVETANSRKYFGQYKGIIKKRISQISSNLSSGEEYKYLKDLSVIESLNKIGSISQREKIWKKTNVLHLLSGIVFDQDNSITVMTQVYMGEIPDYLKKSLVEFELNVSPKEYSKTRDLYSALTLYSILVDAMDKQPIHVISKYFGETNNYVNKLDQGSSLAVELNGALEEIENTLKKKRTMEN